MCVKRRLISPDNLHALNKGGRFAALKDVLNQGDLLSVSGFAAKMGCKVQGREYSLNLRTVE